MVASEQVQSHSRPEPEKPEKPEKSGEVISHTDKADYNRMQQIITDIDV